VGTRGTAAAAAALVAFLLAVSSERMMRRMLAWLPAQAAVLYDSIASLMKPLPLLVAALLSTLAWACECVAFWTVVHGFHGAAASVGLATAVYAASTLAGAVSPGGLGVTELGMAGALMTLGAGIDEATAFGATFLIRLATLWFAVLVGVVALATFQRRYRVDLDAVPVGE
jgi:uncharacterized protein (TIRG00374 family)